MLPLLQCAGRCVRRDDHYLKPKRQQPHVTGNRAGLPVLAVRSGEVFRLICDAYPAYGSSPLLFGVNDSPRSATGDSDRWARRAHETAPKPRAPHAATHPPPRGHDRGAPTRAEAVYAAVATFTTAPGCATLTPALVSTRQRTWFFSTSSLIASVHFVSNWPSRSTITEPSPITRPTFAPSVLLSTTG